MVLDACSRKKKRFQPAVIEELQDREKGKNRRFTVYADREDLSGADGGKLSYGNDGSDKREVQTIVGRMEEENKLFV